MSDLATGGGSAIARDAQAGGDFVGRDEQLRAAGVFVNQFGPDGAPSPVDYEELLVRQVAELRYALLGDHRYGVEGLVDWVQRMRLWLWVISVTLLLLVGLELIQWWILQQLWQGG